MTAPDAPKGRRDPVTLSGVMLACFCCALLIGASGLLWFAVQPALVRSPAPVASPMVVVQQAPWPAEMIAAAKADVARATDQAPTPTATPSPPTPSPTPDPMKFCGIDSVTGEVCRWPQPPAPTPTPYPPCASPVPDDLCIWRQP